MTHDDVARSVLRRLEDAWNAGDGDAFGREYTERARFVNIHGAVAQGSAAIADGHTRILGSIYAGSVNRMRLVEATPVAGDVIVSTSRNTLDCPGGPLAGVHEALVTAVLVQSGANWLIAASQTTLVDVRDASAGVR